MGSKRPQIYSDSVSAVLMDAHNGTKYEVDVNEEFVIGRATCCNIIIEDLFISRRHCIITYKEGEFYIKDNNTPGGTYLNCELLPKENQYLVVLKHGDLIRISDSNTNYYMYKVCLSSNTDKKPKLEEKINNEKKTESACQLNISNEYILMKLKKMHDTLDDLRVEHLVMKNQSKVHIAEVQSIMEKTFKYFENYSKEVVKINNVQNVTINDLSKKLSDKVKQECVDTKTAENESLQLFKIQINDLLENDCQCPICNEVILKAHTSNCHHTFCEDCITKWLSLKKFCPICRSSIIKTHYSLVMDNFITNLCNLLGGSAKHQRDVLKEERKPVPPQIPLGVAQRRNTARRGRRHAMRAEDIAMLFATPPSNNLQEPLLIVDLTNSTASTSSAP